MTIYRGQLLGHQERSSISRAIGERAKQKELLVFEYDSSTANSTIEREFKGLQATPLSLVYYLGTLDADGSIEDSNACIIPNGDLVSCGNDLTADYDITQDEITLNITVGAVTGSNVRKAYFYYLAFYDTTENPAIISTTLNVQYVVPNGLASAEAFGTAIIVSVVQPTGVASAEAFGTPQINQTVYPSGIASAEAFGTAQVSNTGAPGYDSAAVGYDDSGTGYDG